MPRNGHPGVPASVDAGGGIGMTGASRWPARTVRWWLSWPGITAAGATVATLIDLALLQRKFGFLFGGYLAEQHLDTLVRLVSFLAVSLVSDAALVGLAAGLVLRLLDWVPLNRAARAFLAISASLVPIVVHDIVVYDILSYIPGTIDTRVMMDLAQGNAWEILVVASHRLQRLLQWLTIFGLLTVPVVVLLQRWVPHESFAESEEWTRRRRLLPLLGLVVLAIALSAAGRAADSTLDWGIGWKASGRVTGVLLQKVLDADRDGYSLISRPRDPANFDASIHPWAPEVPGNGIDENGVGGDLPLAASNYVETAVPSPVFRQRPDVVVVFLESVRADVLGMQIGDRPVTPTLSDVARHGVEVPYALSETGSTASARFQLFTGSLAGLYRRPTLVDDFNANGYQTVYVSGQDESFGTPGWAVGFDRATHRYDARQEPQRRYTQFATAGSLAVPFDVVNEQVERFLGSIRRDQPLFLYVNYHDTHFPYWHKTVRPLVSPVVVNASDLSASREADLRAMYLNTVANVDAAIGRMLEAVRRTRGAAPAVIVTSDHGESLFDEGFLGHGFGVNLFQNHVPLLASHIDLELPAQLGLSDVRARLLAALGRESRPVPTPVLNAGERPRVYQVAGGLDSPVQIGFFENGQEFVVDLRDHRVREGTGAWRSLDRLDEASAARSRELIWYWESMALARKAARSN